MVDEEACWLSQNLKKSYGDENDFVLDVRVMKRVADAFNAALIPILIRKKYLY